jgi:phytoene synthase
VSSRPSSAGPSDAFAHCEALVRAADKDRYLSALFAPAEHRDALFALYAFNLEIARIREVARAALPGEIRLQWWRDILGDSDREAVAGHPVAAAMLATLARYTLQHDLLEKLIETRRFDVYDEAMMSLADLEDYASGSSSNVIALAAQLLCGGREPDITALARETGAAYAIAGLLKAFPIHAARGQLFVPLNLLERHGAARSDVAKARVTPQLRAALAELRQLARWHLSQADALIATASSEVIPALLPAALVRPTLALMERPNYDPFVPIEIAQWRRQWLLWRAARRPERIFL